MSEHLIRLIYTGPNDPDYTEEIKPDEFPEDVAALSKALQSLGYEASDRDITSAYAAFSEEEYCAGWLAMTSLFLRPDMIAREAKYLINAGYLSPIPDTQQ